LRQAQAEQDFDNEEFNEEAGQQSEPHPNEPPATAGDHDMSFMQQEDDYEFQASNGKLASGSSGFEFEDSLLPIQRYEAIPPVYSFL
jgi:hypothetical protein